MSSPCASIDPERLDTDKLELDDELDDNDNELDEEEEEECSLLCPLNKENMGEKRPKNLDPALW